MVAVKQPAARFQLALRPASAGAVGSPGLAASLRASLAAALGVPMEVVYVGGVVNMRTGALSRFSTTDDLNTAGNVLDPADALDALLAGTGISGGGGRRRARRAQAAADSDIAITGLAVAADPRAPADAFSVLLTAMAPCSPAPCTDAVAATSAARLLSAVKASVGTPAGAAAALAAPLAALELAQGLPAGACNATLNAATATAVVISMSRTRWSRLLTARNAALVALAALLVLPLLFAVAVYRRRRRLMREAEERLLAGEEPLAPPTACGGRCMDAVELRLFGPRVDRAKVAPAPLPAAPPALSPAPAPSQRFAKQKSPARAAASGGRPPPQRAWEAEQQAAHEGEAEAPTAVHSTAASEPLRSAAYNESEGEEEEEEEEDEEAAAAAEEEARWQVHARRQAALVASRRSRAAAAAAAPHSSASEAEESASGGWASGGSGSDAAAHAVLMHRSAAVHKRSAVHVKGMQRAQEARSLAAAGTHLAGVGPRSEYAAPLVRRGGGLRAGTGAGALRAAGALRMGGIDGGAGGASRLGPASPQQQEQQQRPLQRPVGLNLGQAPKATQLSRLGRAAAQAAQVSRARGEEE